jgi:hypothetical protein
MDGATRNIWTVQMSHPEQHPEPFALGGSQMTKALAVLASIAEAAARLRAVNVDRRIQEESAARLKTETAERAATAAREFERGEMLSATRMFRDAIKTKLARADVVQTAKVWQTAEAHIQAGGAEHNPAAEQALALARERMRMLAPDFMAKYDAHRANGVDGAAAVRGAVADLQADFYQRYGAQSARPHGGAPFPALDAQRETVPESFEVAVEGELRDLAAATPPGAADRGAEVAQAAAAAADRLVDAGNPNEGFAETLGTRGRRELVEANVEAATPDNPRTAPNEAVQGLDASATDITASRHDQAVAKALVNGGPDIVALQEAQRAAFPSGPRRSTAGTSSGSVTSIGRTNSKANQRGRR